MTEKQYRVICDDINAYSIHKDNELIVYDLFKSDADRICEELNQIADENEQLKQQIQQLQHWNKCLAQKRHQELSYKSYNTRESEKKLKELLEPKLFNCSDR